MYNQQVVYAQSRSVSQKGNSDSGTKPELRGLRLHTPASFVVSISLDDINQVVSDVFIFLLYDVECVCFHSLRLFSKVDKRYWFFVNTDITSVAC